MSNMKDKLAETRALMDGALDKLLPMPAGPERRVVEAMRYSLLGGGKALRPFLVLSVADMLGLDRKQAVPIACALEMVHTYSLIHDDLPAMDNDTLRRGRPTNHVQFGEATAILAGDGLLTQAFEVLADAPALSADKKVKLIRALAAGAGAHGMIGGQMLDLLGEKTTLNRVEIERMQMMKTGALLRYACLAGAWAAGADTRTEEALTRYADAIGLLFQITDDLLDITGDNAVMGKTLGKDAAAGKSTFVSLMGMDGARQFAADLAARAKDALAPFGAAADILREAADFIVERKN
ncbi:MAG: polyprenyl synthetase family protein [Alphaproteobacteria bacterium]|nr:polyprenyl synthetase family protein [Alphaproteobacteria bacterium]